MIYIDKKAVEMRVPSRDAIPQLDKEQIAAGGAMYVDRNKLLFSDPGAGKTLTALRAWSLTDFQKAVVVCPTIAVRNWAIWAKGYAALCKRAITVQILTGNHKGAVDNLDTDADMVIVTYGTIGRSRSALKRELLARYKYRVFIADESDNLTGLDSIRTEAVLGKHGLADKAVYRWFLTGTPIPRYQDGLWPVLSAMFRGRLMACGIRNKKEFMDRFTIRQRVKYGSMRFPVEKVVGNRNTTKMHLLLYGGNRPIAIRNKLAIRAVPKHRELTLDLKPSKVLLELQKKALNSEPMQTDADGVPISVIDPALSTALHEYGKELAPLVASAVIDLIHKVDGGILVLYWHKEVGRILNETFNNKGAIVGDINGSTPMSTRDDLVDMFNDGRLDILTGQVRAMGVALNLQENCHTVVFAEDTFSDAMNLQAYQRVWRRGQKNDVDIIWAKTLMPLADLRPNVAERKRKGAKEALD